MDNNKVRDFQHTHNYNPEKKSSESKAKIVLIITLITMDAEIRQNWLLSIMKPEKQLLKSISTAIPMMFFMTVPQIKFSSVVEGDMLILLNNPDRTNMRSPQGLNPVPVPEPLFLCPKGINY